MEENVGEVLELSARFVACCPGIAIHAAFGEIRLVYRNQEDWKEYETTDGDKSRNKLRLKTFPSTDCKQLMDFLKAHARVSEDADTEAYVTGAVPEDLKASLEQQLNIKLRVLDNTTCIVGAHHYLFQHVPTKQLKQNANIADDVQVLVGELDRFAKTAAFIMAGSDWELFPDLRRQFKEFIISEAGGKGKQTVVEPEVTPLGPGEYPGLAEMEDSLSYYPCLLVDIEGTVTYLKVNPCGQKFTVLDVNNRGGDSLLGMASLLLGVQDYDELLSLAAQGHHFAVHQSDKSGENKSTQSAKEQKENTYTVMLDTNKSESIMFCYGLGLQKAATDFKKEDIAAALLYNCILDIVTNFISQLVKDPSIKYVMVSGSMLRHPRARQLFLQEYYRRLSYIPTFVGKMPKVPVFILQHAPYFGALGAMVNSVEKFHP